MNVEVSLDEVRAEGIIASCGQSKQNGKSKFNDRTCTADGKTRAHVEFSHFSTLWFNTGTLCNLACANCYIESSPQNDRLVYLASDEVERFLKEALCLDLPPKEIGYTGGEPFMNPDFMNMLEMSLDYGFNALVLTNAMRPMMKHADRLLKLARRFEDQLVIRVSIDHFLPEMHERERGPRSWRPMMVGLNWLYANGFNVRLAGRLGFGESESKIREGFQHMLETAGIALDVQDPINLVLFPEMEAVEDTPEITSECWNLLGVRPQDMMCATSRMVVKHKDDDLPSVASCTLLPYETEFNLGRTLTEALGEVPLNHPHCSQFCVLGGGHCAA